MEPLEKAAEVALSSRVTAAGGLCPKLAPTEAGIPDRLVVYGGGVWLVELKRPSGKLRDIQRAWHAKAKKNGIQVVVLYGANQVNQWLASIGVPEKGPRRLPQKYRHLG